MRVFIKFMLLLFFPLSLYAQLTFVENLTVKTPSSILDLQNEIKGFSLRYKNSILSLGESHIDRNQIEQVNALMFNAFFENRSGLSVLCSEDIEAFFSSASTLAMKKKLKQTVVFKGYGPELTHLKGCPVKNSSTILYSGFFHQQPFVRSFPMEFHPSLVQTKPNNTLKDLLVGIPTMYVSHMELVYLESTATQLLLSNFVRSRSTIEKTIERFKQLEKHLQNIKSEMTLIESRDSNRAVVLSYDDMMPSISQLVSYNTYFVLSDDSERDHEKSLFQRVASGELDQKFLMMMKKESAHYLHILYPYKMGEIRMSYGATNFQQKMHPQSELIILDQKQIVAVIDPTKEKISCFSSRTNLLLESCPWE